MPTHDQGEVGPAGEKIRGGGPLGDRRTAPEPAIPQLAHDHPSSASPLIALIIGSAPSSGTASREPCTGVCSRKVGYGADVAAEEPVTATTIGGQSRQHDA